MNENRVPGLMGRKAPHPELTHPRVKLEAYLNKAELPAPPATIDWCSKVMQWPMYLNDQLGDCTCAAVGHQIQAWSAYGNTEVDPDDNDVLGLYEAVGGYVPGDPSTDNGAVIQDILTYMSKTGIDNQKYLMFAQIQDLSDMNTIYTALDLFGSVYLGINVPQSAMDQFQAQQPWSYVGDNNILGGHAIVVQAKLSTGELDIITWGAVQTMEQSFWDNYVEEAWVVIDPEWVNSKSGKTPTGLNLSALEADFKAL